VIVIDRKKENVKNQPENVIILPEYDGSKEDNELTKLLALLERINVII
jgi:TFIIF-interacting CTD phosphatase-like protein